MTTIHDVRRIIEPLGGRITRSADPTGEYAEIAGVYTPRGYRFEPDLHCLVVRLERGRYGEGWREAIRDVESVLEENDGRFEPCGPACDHGAFYADNIEPHQRTEP